VARVPIGHRIIYVPTAARLNNRHTPFLRVTLSWPPKDPIRSPDDRLVGAQRGTPRPTQEQRAIVDLAARPEFRRRIVFLEDYDVAIARYMVQGCDVWLNTPLRPQEASGTSGMKALANGALNVSTLDGWWDEAWQMGLDSGQEVGWAIGKGES